MVPNHLHHQHLWSGFFFPAHRSWLFALFSPLTEIPIDLKFQLSERYETFTGSYRIKKYIQHFEFGDCSYSYYSKSLRKNYRRKVYLVSFESSCLHELENVTFITVGLWLLYFQNLLEPRRYRIKGVICFGTFRLSLGRGVWNLSYLKYTSEMTTFSSFSTNSSKFLSFLVKFIFSHTYIKTFFSKKKRFCISFQYERCNLA